MTACPKCGSQGYQVGSPCPLCGFAGGTVAAPREGGTAVRVERRGERPPSPRPRVPVTVSEPEHGARIRRGLEEARMKGKTIGRPPKPFDRAKAVALRRQGLGIKTIAKQLKVSRAKVERELAKAGRGDGSLAGARATNGLNLRVLRVKIQQQIADLQKKLEAIQTVERLL